MVLSERPQSDLTESNLYQIQNYTFIYKNQFIDENQSMRYTGIKFLGGQKCMNAGQEETSQMLVRVKVPTA